MIIFKTMTIKDYKHRPKNYANAFVITLAACEVIAAILIAIY